MKYHPGKNLIFFFFLTALPRLAFAIDSCSGSDISNVYCQGGKKETVSRQLKTLEAYNITVLYYSGSILHNNKIIDEINPPQKPPSLIDIEMTNDKNPEIADMLSEVSNDEDLYSKIGKKFQSLKKLQKKDIQKCLRYGSYTAKIDGVWGSQTFEAIIDLKNEIEVGNENQNGSVISKITGAFSNKHSCYKFINKIFEL